MVKIEKIIKQRGIKWQQQKDCYIVLENKPL